LPMTAESTASPNMLPTFRRFAIATSPTITRVRIYVNEQSPATAAACTLR
jgi:hypothetical protein